MMRFFVVNSSRLIQQDAYDEGTNVRYEEDIVEILDRRAKQGRMVCLQCMVHIKQTKAREFEYLVLWESNKKTWQPDVELEEFHMPLLKSFLSAQSHEKLRVDSESDYDDAAEHRTCSKYVSLTDGRIW